MTEIHSILVSVSEQTLNAYDEQGEVIFCYPIATAKNGFGQTFGSECTPLGEHVIRAKIGQDQPVNTVFVGRRPSGEIYTEQLAKNGPNRDWILSRILWLSGLELGFNRLGQVDTMRRYIYIHGAPDSHPMQVPSSHGCIKMRNEDIIELYDLVSIGTTVTIKE